MISPGIPRTKHTDYLKRPAGIFRAAVQESDDMDFTEELNRFLNSLGGCPGDVSVVPVPLSFFSGGSAAIDEAASSLLDIRTENARRGIRETVFIYEDRWRSSGPAVRDRLRSHLRKGVTVFARNCEVREISQEKAAAFLNRYHPYGATKAPFRYGLFRVRATGKGECGMSCTPVLVAAGTFSGKNEWERYASLPSVRVTGGMGKLLDTFIKASSPEEVMSWADLEWSDGDVYKKLGFRMEKPEPPVHFLVEPVTYRRIHLHKFGRDRRFRAAEHEGWTEIANPGSAKALLDIKKF